MSTISGTITHGVKLGTEPYQSPLTITATGAIAPSAYGVNGIFVPATLQDGSITNAGVVSGAFRGNYVSSGGIGVSSSAAVLLTNSGGRKHASRWFGPA